MRTAIDAFDAVGDVPIPALYPQLSERYPEAKFLLVWRDPRKWVRSVRNHIGSRALHQLEKIQYWRYFNSRPEYLHEFSDEELVRVYDQHKAEIVAFFAQKGPDRLGVFQLESPNIDRDIARFLGHEHSEPFPILGRSDAAVPPSGAAASA
jgi:hypothetical protein